MYLVASIPEKADNTYLRLADSEHFDMGLTEVFRNTSADDTIWFSGSGDFIVEKIMSIK